jgi:hypothetical protein
MSNQLLGFSGYGSTKIWVGSIRANKFSGWSKNIYRVRQKKKKKVGKGQFLFFYVHIKLGIPFDD